MYLSNPFPGRNILVAEFVLRNSIRSLFVIYLQPASLIGLLKAKIHFSQYTGSVIKHGCLVNYR